MRQVTLGILLMVIGCGYFGIMKVTEKPRPTDRQLLEERYKDNLSKIQGWPSRTDCDATLWAGIAKAGGVQLDISESQKDTGQWYRRPSMDCYKLGHSRSTFSNDMLAGVILSANDSQLRNFYGFIRLNNYVMGSGDPGAVVLKPNMLGVLGRRIGMNLAPRYPYIANSKDYVRHIQMLMIYMDGKNTGFITESELKLLKSYEDDIDYLLSAILARYTGKYDKATNLLLAEGKPPTYVRGDEPERYRLAHWLFAARIILGDK